MLKTDIAILYPILQNGIFRQDQNLIRNLLHEELAYMIGTVRVIVNRLLDECCNEGLIEISGGEIQVNNLENLL